MAELCLGGLYTSSLAGGVSETTRLLAVAHEAGVRWIDTAPAYADSEATLGRALGELGTRAEDFRISTKLGGRPQPFDPQDAAALRASVEESRKLLGRDRFEILHLHEPDRPRQYRWWTSWSPVRGPVLDVLDDLRQRAVVERTGVAGTTVTELTHLVRSGLFDAVLTAFNANALFREAAAELLPAARERGMTTLVGSILGQGCLAKRFDALVTAPVSERPFWLAAKRAEQLAGLYRLSERSGLSLPELAVRHARQWEVNLVLVGARTEEQLVGSLAAWHRGELPADVTEELDRLAALLPQRPFEEPMILPLGRDYDGAGPANVGAAVKVGQGD